MTTTSTTSTSAATSDTAQGATETTDAWRGRMADQQQADVEKHAAPGQAKALLWDLLRPYRKTVFLLAITVVLENAARLSVPRLVQVGVDDGVPRCSAPATPACSPRWSSCC